MGPEWSPDSKTLVAFRIEPGEQKEVYLVESSPKAGGRAVLHTRKYPLPGDNFTAYELHLFDIAERNEIACQVERIDFGTPRLRWNKDGHTFTYQKIDRGHQRLRLIEVDAYTGRSRDLIDEQSQTFIWTAHTENVNLRPFHWLEKSDELIYVSERDGWRHLYLVDTKEGAIKNQCERQYVVRGIGGSTKTGGKSARACGRNPDQIPISSITTV
jgi:Tol biopolymer transport system component